MKIKHITLKDNEDELRSISAQVDFNDKELKDDIKALTNYCKKISCFALSSIQIGIPKRIIYLKNTTLIVDIENKEYDEERILINPTITSRKGLTEFWEACYSCGEYMGLVERPYEIEVTYYDINANIHTETFRDFEATVLSHEYDHLDGKLHIDIAKKILKLSKEERIEFRKTHQYRIVSKDCDYTSKLIKKKI